MSRAEQEPTAPTTTGSTPVKGVNLGKGRPTPKRAKAGRGPVPPPPASRKEAARRLREQQVQLRKTGKGGPSRSDDELLLKRDQGPVRALVRDVVDSRRNVGVLLLPFALAVVIAQLVGEPLLSLVLRIYPVTLILVIVDSVVLARAVGKAVRERFPDDQTSPLRHAGYAILRSTVVRRFRMPRPRVAAASFRRRRST